jgi:hypothetical protein
MQLLKLLEVVVKDRFVKLGKFWVKLESGFCSGCWINFSVFKHLTKNSVGFTRRIVCPLRHFLLILSLKFAIEEINIECGKRRDFLKQKLSSALS